MNTELFDPLLWWPSEKGPQNMYTLSVSLHDREGALVSQIARNVGFRRVRLLANKPIAGKEDRDLQGRNPPPMTLEVNGERIFCKGSNWMPAEIFPGIMGEDTYRPLLEKARAAHFNMLRCWGGGVVNKGAFFDICDELGLLVWQEFPLACNQYVETPEYLNTLDQESRSILMQLKRHPSVVIWSGGSELFTDRSGMTDQHKAIRLLNRNCYELDPETPFLPTSPVMEDTFSGKKMDGNASSGFNPLKTPPT